MKKNDCRYFPLLSSYNVGSNGVYLTIKCLKWLQRKECFTFVLSIYLLCCLDLLVLFASLLHFLSLKNLVSIVKINLLQCSACHLNLLACRHAIGCIFFLLPSFFCRIVFWEERGTKDNFKSICIFSSTHSQRKNNVYEIMSD